MKLGMVINRDRCIGCQTCAMACKMQNNVPMGLQWNRVVVEGSTAVDGAAGTYPALSGKYLPIACQHCERPACMAVCPAGATYKDEAGRVLVDYEKCIGCGLCLDACPYDARCLNSGEIVRDPDFNYGDSRVPVRETNVAEKCTFCKERTDCGEQPMCVVCCPTDARVFGDLDDPESEVSKLVREKGAYALMEEAGTEPQVLYFV